MKHHARLLAGESASAWVASSRHRLTGESRASATLDSAVVEEGAAAFVAAFEWGTKWRRRPGGKSRCPVEPVDKVLARHGITLPAGPHSMSLYRQYEEAIVAAAYKRMGIVRPADIARENSGEATPENCARLYLLGLTMAEVAQTVGRPHNTVADWLKKAGVKSRARYRRNLRAHTNSKPKPAGRQGKCNPKNSRAA